jgi:glycolate oxidase
MPKAEAVKTALAIYESNEDAGRTVTGITERGITPVAVEMLDGVMLRMVEEATHAGYPMDAAAVLLIELEGLTETVEEQVEQVREACLSCGAREFRVARSAQERELLWQGRKNAFGAVGRVSPTYYVQDGVVPRTKIAPTLRFIGEVARKYGLTISNIFHAGDGNMHPIILFDARKPGELEKAKAAGEEILTYCIEAGGSITGEHGVGMEKNELMPKLFTPETLDAIRGLKLLFDPESRLNPGKLLPTGRGCMEIRQPFTPPPPGP